MRFKHVVAALTVSAVSGCASHGAKVDRSHSQPAVENGMLTTSFSEHNFSSACFDTIKCLVLYNNRYVTDDVEPSGTLTDDDRRNLSATWLGIKNFPSPVRVTWISKDGTSHDEKIDLNEIFRSRLVRYAPDIDLKKVDLKGYYFPPDIILVVENRAIHVYMKAWVWLVRPSNPSNKHSDFREDLVVAYTHEF